MIFPFFFFEFGFNQRIAPYFTSFCFKENYRIEPIIRKTWEKLIKIFYIFTLTQLIHVLSITIEQLNSKKWGTINGEKSN